MKQVVQLSGDGPVGDGPVEVVDLPRPSIAAAAAAAEVLVRTAGSVISPGVERAIMTTRLDDCVSLNSNATISGMDVLGSDVLVGAVVLRGLRVGSQALVGDAACVTRDVARRDAAVSQPDHSG